SHTLQGDLDSARREFEPLAQQGFRDLRRDENWLMTIGVLSNVAVSLEDRARGALLYDLFKPYAGLIMTHDLLRSIGSSVASELGALATLLERYDEGIAHYEKAVAQETAMEVVPSLVDSLAGLAHLLLQRGRARDLPRVDALLDEVQTRSAA